MPQNVTEKKSRLKLIELLEIPQPVVNVFPLSVKTLKTNMKVTRAITGWR